MGPTVPGFMKSEVLLNQVGLSLSPHPHTRRYLSELTHTPSAVLNALHRLPSSLLDTPLSAYARPSNFTDHGPSAPSPYQPRTLLRGWANVQLPTAYREDVQRYVPRRWWFLSYTTGQVLQLCYASVSWSSPCALAYLRRGMLQLRWLRTHLTSVLFYSIVSSTLSSV